jgi:cell division protein FtsI/penicillin-binding protein 2
MLARLNIIAAVLAVLSGLLVFRLFQWQVIKGQSLATQAESQYRSGGVVKASRGNILASDGQPLAETKEAWLVAVSLPDLMVSSSKAAASLAAVLGDDADRIQNLLERKGYNWMPIKHKVTTEEKNNLAALGLKGLIFEPEESRGYPEASAAAHLLGFVGKDSEGNDTGYFGLEGNYDLVLSGQAGYRMAETDARGLPIPVGNFRETSALKGVDLLTNLDRAVQLEVEKKLAEGIVKYGAKGGTVIVANPATGAILAMSSYPAFDPARYADYGDSYFKNPAISDSFEPGSIFKILVMAAALDAKVVTPETVCDICTGPFRIDKYTIETWDNKYHPDSTITDVIVHSDNVGMVFVGRKLGIDAMYRYLTKFGIGQKTEIDLQGESVPALRAREIWSEVDLATSSFGQGVAVTPIEMVRAVSAIANGGFLPQPEVVKQLKGENWQETILVKTEPILSPQACAEMTAMMVEAARNGESKWTNLRGFSVAGKTGTAQIPIAGHYDPQNVIASFIGFAPANNPKFIMLVTLKEPSSSRWASETAAPLWYAIAKDLFVYYGIGPES